MSKLIEILPNEIWKPVIGFLGYELSFAFSELVKLANTKINKQ
jgi:hypothetical protein